MRTRIGRLAGSKRRTGSLTPGVGWWKLNENTGTSAADSTGNGNTGTLTNGPTWTTGPNSNGAVTLDGTDDYIAIANESNFDFELNQAFSITAWIKVHTSATAGRIIVSKEKQTGNGEGIDFRVDTDNAALRVYLINASGFAIQAAGAVNSFTSNVWRLVAFTYDGSLTGAGLKTYINNALDATGTGTITGSILNDNPLWIGRGAVNNFYGDIDDVRVYSRELSATEVANLYAEGAQ